LFLENALTEIQNFSITHGYNLFIVNRGWNHKRFILHGGAGMIIAHPETTIRKKRYSEKKGFFIKVITFQVRLSREQEGKDSIFIGNCILQSKGN